MSAGANQKIEKTERKMNYAGILFSGGLIIFLTSMSQSTDTLGITDWDASRFGLLHTGILLAAIGAFWMFGELPRWVDALSEDNLPSGQRPQDTDKIEAQLNSHDLRTRSDHLDRVRNNLRTGASILIGIGSALLIWITPLSMPTAQQLAQQLILSTGILAIVLMAVIGILFSFGNPFKRSSQVTIGEGLIPKGINESEYRNQLEMVVIGKEDMLTAMRTSIGVGLLLFVVLSIIALVSPAYLTYPSVLDSNQRTIEILYAMSAFTTSGFVLLAALGRLGYLVIGRHFLCIVGVSSSDILKTGQDASSESK